MTSSDGLPAWLGRHVLVQRIGSGGMGDVFLALKAGAGVERPVIAKTVRKQHVHDDFFLSRFVDEARTAVLLHHQNLCATYDLEDIDGTLVLSMEYISGRDLRVVYEVLTAGGGALDVDSAVAVGCAVLDGLHHAHELSDPRSGEPLGLVHRDISPHNIMVSFDGVAKVIDFGIARSRLQQTHTESGAVVGKLSYMPPEQVTGARALDRRADVFSVGVVLAELLSGRRFYRNQMEAMAFLEGDNAAFVSATIPLVPERLRPVVVRALHPDPRERYADALAFRDALQAEAPRASTSTLKATMARLFPGAADEDQQLLRAHWAAAAVFVAEGHQTFEMAPLPRSESTVISTAEQSTAEQEAATVAGKKTPLEPTVILPTPQLPVHDQATVIALAPPPPPSSSRAAPWAAVFFAVAAVFVVAAVFFANAGADIVDAGSVVVVDAGAAVVVDAGVVVVVAAPVVVDAGAPIVAPITTTTTPKKKPTKTLPPRPVLFGERVGYLRTWCAKTSCTPALLRRAAVVDKATAPQIAQLRAEVAACLDRCGAP